MGTSSEWLSILTWAGLFGGAMAWWSAKIDRAPAMFNPKWLVERIEHAVSWMLAALLVEILTTFHWQRVIHRPLVFVTLGAVVGLLIMGRSFRKGHDVADTGRRP
jgi:hypothetical protein